MRKIILLLGIPTLTILLMLVFHGHQSAYQGNRANMKIAGSIITAIEQYGKEYRNYAKELNELTPHYLDGIPSTTTNHAFLYRRDIEDGYYLCFGQNEMAGFNPFGCCYTPKFGWECTPGE